MPESIAAKKERYVKKYGIPPQVGDVLSSDNFIQIYLKNHITIQTQRKLQILSPLILLGFADTREKKLELKITAQAHLFLADAILNNKITRNSGKHALQEMVKTGKSLSGDSF